MARTVTMDPFRMVKIKTEKTDEETRLIDAVKMTDLSSPNGQHNEAYNLTAGQKSESICSLSQEMPGSSSQESSIEDIKREVRLLKNRTAARNCRRRKSQYIYDLEGHMVMLESENRRLRMELQCLYHLYTITRQIKY